MWKIWRSSRECCCVLLALLIGPPPGRPAASRAARSQQSSSLHPQEPLMSSSSLSVTPKSYFCLIGGESCDTQGADLHRREYLHTSLFFVGKAYDQLRTAGVPRSQIITIVQLQDYLRSPLLAEDCYARTSTLQSCHRLLAEGGADYDFELVNSGTVFAVLLGLGSNVFHKVVPNDSSTRSLFFAIYSHGNCHPILSQSVRSVPPSSQALAEDRRARVVPPHISPHDNEWFAHFPYPCQPPEYRELMYAFVSTEGGCSNGHKAPECQLYATHIAMIITRLYHNEHQQQSSQLLSRPVVGLLNFCRSGGGLDFMRREGFRSFYQPQHWPVFLMSSAQANKDALVGGLWDSYFQCLVEQLSGSLVDQTVINSSTTTVTTVPSSVAKPQIQPPSPPSVTLHGLFLAAATLYRKRNVYELYGHICAEAYPSCGKTFRSDLQPLLYSGPFGAPDFPKIAQLQQDYKSRGDKNSKYKRKIYIYDTYNWGVEVDLVTVVTRCLLHIALPDCVFGEQSGVDQCSARDTFYYEVEAL